MVNRKRLVIGILFVSLIEIIYFYFMGKQFVYLNGLDTVMRWVVIGNVLFFLTYFVLLDASNFRKKTAIIVIAYGLLVAAPFIYHAKMPSTTMGEAESLIMRTEGGKTIKDRDYANKIETYQGKEVYLISIEKEKKVKRFAFNPENQRYYPFSN